MSDEAEIALSSADAEEAEDDADEDALVDKDDGAEAADEAAATDADAGDANNADESSPEDSGSDGASKPTAPEDDAAARKKADAAANGRSAVAVDAENAPLSANHNVFETEVSSAPFDFDISSSAAGVPSARTQINRPNRAAADCDGGARFGSQSDCNTRRNRSG